MYKEMKKNGMLLTALASSIALATSAAAEEEYDFNLDTISVSANKYSQDMVSLSGQAEVADEKTLDKNEIRGVKDISKVVSAVTPAVGFGSRQLTKYTIRGVNSGNIYNSGVAVYVDGIAQPFSQMNQQFNDVGSVEVLKGPQGTIYGEGAQVGIINVTTKNPMFDGNYAEVETDYSKLYWKNKLDAGGALYEDTVYGKIGIVSQKDYGWIKDLDGSNYNTGESYGVNGALYFNGGEKVPLTVTLGGSYNKDRGHQSNVALTESEYRDGKLSGHGINRNPDFTRSYIAGMMAADPGVAAYFGGYEEAYTALYNSGAIKDEIDPVEHRNAYTAYVKLDYYRDNGDTINSVTSVNRSDSCELYMMGQGRCGNNNIQTRQFSQEVRYVAELGQSGSRSDSGKAVIGVNATKTTTDNFVLAQVDVSDNEMYQALLGGSQYVPIGQVDLRADDLSVSWFGDLVYNFGVGDESVFDIDLGARYEHDLSKANGTYNFNSKMDRVAKDDDLIDYKVAFGFSYVPGQRVYVLSSSGSKAGGFSKFPTSDLDDKGYDAEKTYNYELGYHMSYDNGFDANMALFYMDVHDRQAYTIVENSYMTPLRNIGQMHSAGAELTMGYRSERAVAGISMTYADAKNETSGYTKHPSNAPKFVTATLVDVTAFKGDGFAWHIGGNGRYQSKTYFGEGYTDMFAANNLKQEYQGGYSLFDLYTSAELIKNIEIKAYVENVFDKKYSNSIDNGSSFGVRFHSMAAPRNVGLKLKYSF
jgi:outer membrane receptor protein involved in Fe transport